MNKILKWIGIIVAAMAVIVIVAVIVAPMVINLNKYKPRIEAEAAKAVGRPVTLGGEIAPSVFPWIGMAISDVQVGNPPGFEEKDFVSIGGFEVRVKLLPLLFGQYEVKRFVLKDPRIVLEKREDGLSNLDGLGRPDAAPPAEKPGKAPAPEPQTAEPPAPSQIPIKSLVVGEFAITNGGLLYIDHGTGARHEIREIDLTLNDVSLDKAIQLDFRAVADGHPVTVTGSVGPVGPEPGKSPVNIDLVATILKELTIQLQGRVDDPSGSPQLDMHLQVAPFSPRKLMAALKQPLPVDPADPKVLNAVALSMKLAGTPESVRIADGSLTLDDSKMVFSAQAKAFEKPDLTLAAELDRIDLDRYLPAASPAEERPAAPKEAPAPQDPKKTDYAPLRKLVLDARFKIGDARIKNVRMQNLALKATAKNGIIRLDPLDLDFYRGRLSATGTFNVQQDRPRSTASLAVGDVQAAPLIKDLMDKELIEGMLAAAVNLQFSGDSPDLIRRTLSGNGELSFIDGAIVGIDLADMVRNVQAAFGLAEQPGEKPRTDFSELIVPFSIDTGVARLGEARLNSPLLRLTAGGTADLVKETLNLRVEPKFVASLKGQADTAQLSGIVVPVMVSGSFDDPTFRPDLRAILSQPLPDREALQQMIPPKETIKEEAEQRARDLLDQKGQELFRRLPFGTQPREAPQD